jgi:hypothetical protein
MSEGCVCGEETDRRTLYRSKRVGVCYAYVIRESQSLVGGTRTLSSRYTRTIKIMKITIKTLQQKVFYVSFIFWSPSHSLILS